MDFLATLLGSNLGFLKYEPQHRAHKIYTTMPGLLFKMRLLVIPLTTAIGSAQSGINHVNEISFDPLGCKRDKK
jgi:hypothetical protein